MQNSPLFAQIRSKYAEMTSVERIIADYFLDNPSPETLEPARIASTLFVSKASLSRFAQKLGFDGFREFLFTFKKTRDSQHYLDALHSSDRTVYEDYSFILNESLKNIDNAALAKATSLICSSKRILIYGDGLSGYAASEFMTRFKRLGFLVEASTNDFMMQTNSTIVEPSALVIGISLSGRTKNTILGLKKAHQNGAKTLLITAGRNNDYEFDVILYTSSLPQMSTGILISPQLPILFMIDLLFNRVIAMDSGTYIANYHDTLDALKHNENELRHPSPGRRF